MPIIEQLDWDAIRAVVLPAWEETERRGAQLLFVVPLFGGILSISAFFAIRETFIPALVIALGVFFASIYLVRGRKRLHGGRARILTGRLLDKYVHTSTSSAKEKSIRHYLKVEIVEAAELMRNGDVSQVTETGITENLTTTTKIYEQVNSGDELTIVTMPHDNAVYFLIRPPDKVLG